ncbi:MAG: lactonase family protein [bacterium]|nr:lactonase family protein [bacterium]
MNGIRMNRRLAMPLICVLGLSAAGVLAAQPTLTLIEIETDGVDGVDGLEGALDLTLSTDGAHLYVGAQNDAAVAAFGRDPETGLVTFIEALFDGQGGVDGLDGLQGLTISPDDAHVYSASSVDNALAVFDRDAGTGRLTFVETETDFGTPFLSQPQDVVVSPDGGFVYATIFQGRVAVYTRDQPSGSLTFSSSFGSDVFPFDPLVGAEGLTISSNGEHLYVAAVSDDTLSVFGIGPSTGALTMLEIHTDGVLGVDGLEGASGVIIGPRGETLYATGREDQAVAIFDRDPATGLLTYRSVVRNGVDGVEGLWGANRMAISPSGLFFFVGSLFDGRIVMFERDAAGDLTFVQAFPTGGVNGVGGSPDGAHLYLTTFSTLRAYLTPPTAPASIFADGFESGDLLAWGP